MMWNVAFEEIGTHHNVVHSSLMCAVDLSGPRITYVVEYAR